MKKILSLLVFAALMTAGCSTTKTDKVDVEIESSPDVNITNISIVQQDAVVKVSGRLRPTQASVSRAGHVNVEFLSADGTVIKVVHVQPNTKLFSRQSSRRPSFKAEVEVDGFSRVRFVHHASTDEH